MCRIYPAEILCQIFWQHQIVLVSCIVAQNVYLFRFLLDGHLKFAWGLSPSYKFIFRVFDWRFDDTSPLAWPLPAMVAFCPKLHWRLLFNIPWTMVVSKAPSRAGVQVYPSPPFPVVCCTMDQDHHYKLESLLQKKRNRPKCVGWVDWDYKFRTFQFFCGFFYILSQIS